MGCSIKLQLFAVCFLSSRTQLAKTRSLSSPAHFVLEAHQMFPENHAIRGERQQPTSTFVHPALVFLVPGYEGPYN